MIAPRGVESISVIGEHADVRTRVVAVRHLVDFTTQRHSLYSRKHNKGMGGLTVARDGKVIYSRSFGYRRIRDTQRQPLDGRAARQDLASGDADL
jgi:hypothetical protein